VRPRHLPPLLMTWGFFQGLPDYSHSTPTGVSPGVTWRRWEGSCWVVGRYEEIPGDAHHLRVAWYYPAALPDGATLTECRGWWIGQSPGFTTAGWDWYRVIRELWRHAGHRMGICRAYHRPELEQAGEGT
jgi:hypothetical protein